MKAAIEVGDRREGSAIKAALEDPVLRATVIICGLLLPLDKKERGRVMQYVNDKLKDEGAAP